MNPYAPPFYPVCTDQHIIYLTFSNGYPLTESQVFNYFYRLYPPHVEKVYVFRPRGGRGQPLFGNVVFKHSLIPGLFLGDHEKVCVSVEGRHLYCRRFVRQNTETGAPASNSPRDGGSHHGSDDE